MIPLLPPVAPTSLDRRRTVQVILPKTQRDQRREPCPPPGSRVNQPACSVQARTAFYGMYHTPPGQIFIVSSKDSRASVSPERSGAGRSNEIFPKLFPLACIGIALVLEYLITGLRDPVEGERYTP